MDINRVENTLLTGATVGLGAGAVGYALPRMTDKQGNLSLDMEKHMFENMLQNDVFQHNNRVYLVSLNSKLTERDIDGVMKKLSKDKNFDEEFAKDVIGALNKEGKLIAEPPYNLELAKHLKGGKLPDEKAELLKNIQKGLAEASEKRVKFNQKALETFVKNHVDDLGLKPKDGQRMKEAIKEFLQGKTAKDVAELYLPETNKNVIISKLKHPQTYLDTITDSFSEVFDAAKKQFKEGADKDTVAWFKKSLHGVRSENAKAYAFVAGGFALLGAAIANIIDAHKS